MANDDPKHDPQGDAATAGKGKPRRRPPPTIDLAATDVTPAGEEAATAASEPSPAPETPAADAGSDAASEPPPAPVHPTGIPHARAAAAPSKRQLGLVSGLVLALVSGLLGGAFALAVVSTFSSAEQNVDAITDLEARALDLRQRIDALESGLSSLGGRVNEIGSAPAAAADPALGTRIGALEDKVAALPAASASANPDEVAALGARLGALEQRVGAIPAPTPAATPQDIASANARIGALEQRVAEVSSRQQTSGQGAAQLIALDALHDAIANGRPFATELKASRALLGAGGDTLAALEPSASEGFAAGPALAARLKAATAPSPEPAPAPETGVSAGEQGVLDRLLDGARGLVTVRRSTQAPASAGTEELAGADAALVRGDYAGALAALAALPSAEKAAAAPVVSAIEARQAALATVSGLSQQVLASFAGGNQ